MYPINKYKIWTDDNNWFVTAISSYAGKEVKGVAKKHPDDEYNFDFGAELAATRCGEKIAKKRLKRAKSKLSESSANLVKAFKYFQKMQKYYADASEQLDEYQKKLRKLLEKS